MHCFKKPKVILTAPIIIERVEIEIGFNFVLKSKHHAVWDDKQRKKIEVGLVAKKVGCFGKQPYVQRA